ncbi:N5-glutamine S-adenosyl-L-methionine-dependent methyltransferase [Enhygromyxa salina]|uniref:N5-glutamine S-adenosyl-L-methionine-dependent methyltransferase n=1 Tax=Enhygromyxa salina TaxID=215803 RepID=A0A2S9XKP7_9BACT|nr:methyltransferase [Enhygromyxa salina]PRP93251.1 N5-glutamine S-adenosyl-L-methionine-dependent methyltransferase [Enhygromyxa salina]
MARKPRPAAPGPGGLDGLNPDDPGVRMLAEIARTVEPRALALVHCGDLPGLRAGATRLILDVRERTGSPHECIADLGREDPSAPPPFGDARFEAAMVWPRAHLGKDFSEACLALGALALAEGGRLYCAARKQKGGKSLARTMRALLGDEAVEVVGRDRGYHLYRGVRGPDFRAELADELSTRSYEIRDPALGQLALDSRPGVFCRRELDAGTRALIAVTDAILRRDDAAGSAPPRRVLDLCAGIGPLALWAASRLEHAQVVAVESNLRACALIRHNAARNQLEQRVRVIEHDGPPEPEPKAAVELALLNPPTHADAATLTRLLDLRPWLAPGGRMILVVSRPHRAVEILTELGAEIEGGERDGYFVLQARFGRRRPT